jgi:hypothetical protein
MRTEKPQKRLVSKGRYAWVMTTRVAFGSGSLLCSVLGAGVALFAAVALCQGDRQGPHFAWTAAGLFSWAYLLSKKRQNMASVMPLTKQTSHLLPPEESLVRASNAPPSEQPTELLRAARAGPETPQEQLLRATQSNADPGASGS